jgi:hypothetical protein
MRTEPVCYWVLGMALCTLAGAAQAEVSPYSLGAGLSWARDDNIFRAPAGQEVADSYTSVFVTGKLDQAISRQRLQANATLTTSHFNQRGDLDNTGYGLQLSWNGSTVENISWALSHDAHRSLASYANADSPDQRIANIETSQQTVAAAQLGMAAQWATSLTLSHRALNYSAPAYVRSEFQLNSEGLSLQWRPQGPVSLQLGPRFSQGHYPQARAIVGGGYEADAFQRRDIDLSVNWLATGDSNLSARVSQTAQHYDVGRERDFEGATGLLDWRWRLTGKTQLNLTVNRDTGTETSFFGINALGRELRGTGDNSDVTTGLATQIDHQLSGKLALHLGGRLAWRRVSSSTRIEGDGLTVAQSNQTGTERSGNVTLGLRYAPTYNSSVGCDLAHMRRAATATTASSYRADTLVCSAQLSVR